MRLGTSGDDELLRRVPWWLIVGNCLSGWSVPSQLGSIPIPLPSPICWLRVGLSLPSLILIACPFSSRSLSRPLRCCTIQSPFPLWVHQRHFAAPTICRLPSTFVELLLNLFSQRLLTLPLLAATCRVVPCLACQWTLVPSPFPCVLHLLLLRFLFFFSSSFSLTFYYHYHRIIIHQPLRLRLLHHARVLFLFYRHSRRYRRRPSNIIGQTLKKKEVNPKEKKVTVLFLREPVN